MTTSPQVQDLLRRLIAGVLLVAAVAGVPIALWELGGAYLPDELPSWEQVTTALSGPDTGALFLGLLVVIGWIAWACFTLSVTVELASQLRGLPPMRLPGLAAPQQMAGLLVAAVLGVGSGPLLAAPALAGPPVVAEQPIGHAEPPSAPAPPADTPPAAPAPAGPTYTVQPRDTLGRIAARYLGDWARFEEILELNRGRPQPDGALLTDPGLIRPGWTLVLPPDASLPEAGATAGEVTVQPGDTLADLAEQNGLEHWQPIFDLNVGEPLPGGGRFTDPDLIRPGQVLDIPPADPATADPATSDPAPSATPVSPAEKAPPALPGESESSDPAESTPATSPTSARPSERSESPSADVDGRDADESPAPSELVAVLAGSGALLAAGVGAVWLAYRRRRLRRRRPGRRLASLPRELVGAQRTVTAAADAGHADYAALDRAVRSLAVKICEDPEGRLPDVVAARLDSRHLGLRLYALASRPPPDPWTADETGLWWTVQLDQDTGVPVDLARARLAPYPALVTIGSDSRGRWLLDLERMGAVHVAGTVDRRDDFARHLAAELAVNSWSDLLTVTTVGFGRELVDLAPHRVHPVESGSHIGLDESGESGTVDVLDGRLRAGTGDGWMPQVVLAPHDIGDDGELAEAAAAL